MDAVINTMIIIIIMLILFFLFVFLVNSLKGINKTIEKTLPVSGEEEGMVNVQNINDAKIKWTLPTNCRYEVPKIIKDVLKANNIEQTSQDQHDWHIYVPCSYNNTQEEIKNIKPTNLNQRLFIVNGADELGGKNNLWINLVKKYGRNEAKKLAPLTYILYDVEDLRLLNKEFKKDDIYIMKKNIQRQEGLKLSNNKEEILKGFKKGYVVCQELLQNPFLINDRKINLRFYLLLVCQNNEMSAYVHNNGFMYYTRLPFKKGVMKEGPNITTGYIERWVYDVNPLTHVDFKNYLKEKKIVEDPSMVFKKIYNLIAKCVKAMDTKVCIGSQIKNNVSFQLFGVDISLDESLNPMIMEANLGPSIEPFDERDGIVKNSVINDILKVIKVIPDQDNNGYLRIVG